MILSECASWSIRSRPCTFFTTLPWIREGARFQILSSTAATSLRKQYRAYTSFALPTALILIHSLSTSGIRLHLPTTSVQPGTSRQAHNPFDGYTIERRPLGRAPFQEERERRGWGFPRPVGH